MDTAPGEGVRTAGRCRGEPYRGRGRPRRRCLPFPPTGHSALFGARRSVPLAAARGQANSRRIPGGVCLTLHGRRRPPSRGLLGGLRADPAAGGGESDGCHASLASIGIHRLSPAPGGSRPRCRQQHPPTSPGPRSPADPSALLGLRALVCRSRVREDLRTRYLRQAPLAAPPTPSSRTNRRTERVHQGATTHARGTLACSALRLVPLGRSPNGVGLSGTASRRSGAGIRSHPPTRVRALQESWRRFGRWARGLGLLFRPLLQRTIPGYASAIDTSIGKSPERGRTKTSHRAFTSGRVVAAKAAHLPEALVGHVERVARSMRFEGRHPGGEMAVAAAAVMHAAGVESPQAAFHVESLQ